MEKRTTHFLIMENLVLFLLGSGTYGLIEVAFRGRTHYSMLLAGGICFLLLHAIGRMRAPLVIRCLLGGVAITAVEFVFGVVFNLALHMRVWDYSAQPLNILGQVCLPFTAVWCALSAVAFWLDKKLRRCLATRCDLL